MFSLPTLEDIKKSRGRKPSLGLPGIVVSARFVYLQYSDPGSRLQEHAWHIHAYGDLIFNRTEGMHGDCIFNQSGLPILRLSSRNVSPMKSRMDQLMD